MHVTQVPGILKVSVHLFSEPLTGPPLPRSEPQEDDGENHHLGGAGFSFPKDPDMP